jgi:hypothetical protein
VTLRPCQNYIPLLSSSLQSSGVEDGLSCSPSAALNRATSQHGSKLVWGCDVLCNK